MKIHLPTLKESIAMIAVLPPRAAIGAVLLVLATSNHVWAATDTWSGANSGSWNDSGNWSGGVPVSTSTATFANNVNTSVTLASPSITQSILFSTASAGAFTIGTTGGPSLTLVTGGTISTDTGVAQEETINAPLIIGANNAASTYSFSSAATSVSGFLAIGGTVSGAASTGTTTLTLGGANAGNNTISGVISDGGAGGALAITKSSAGTWILSGANTYSGGTSVGGGTLDVVTGGTLGAAGSNLTVSSGTLDLGNTTQTTGTLTISGGLIQHGTVTGTTFLATNTGSITAVLAGAGATLTKTGAGTFTLGGANTYTGGTTVSAGILAIGNANALVNSSSVTVNGGTLENGSFTDTINNLSGTGGVVDSNIVSGGATLTINQTVNGTFAGAITRSNAGTFNITKTGSATLTLSGANTWNNSATISNGALVIDGSTGSVANTVALKMGGGAFIYDNTNTASGARSQTVASLAITGGENKIQSTLGGATTATLTIGTTTIPGVTSTGVGNFVVSGGVNGTTNGIVLTGASAGFLSSFLFFNGADYAYMNSTGGYVRAAVYGTDSGFVNAGSSLSSGNNNQVSSSITGQGAVSVSTLKFATSGEVDLALTGALTLTNNGILRSGGGATTISGSSIFASSTGAVNYSIRADSASDSLTINSVIGNNANNTTVNGLVKSGSGTLTLGGINTYSGVTTIDGGVLSISQNVNLGNQTTGAGITINNGELQATGSFGLNQNNPGTHDRAITVTNSADIDVTGSNNLSVTGVISGTGSLTKSNTGTLTVTNANTYSGGTTVGGGSLVLNNASGSATGTGALAVGAGATLLGTGTSSGTSFAINGTSTSARANLLVGQGSAADMSTTGVTTLTATGASTIANANLTFNLDSGNVGAASRLNVGATAITFGAGAGSTVLSLNIEGTSIIPAQSAYILIAGTALGTSPGTSQYSGLTFGASTGTLATGLSTLITGGSANGSGNLVLGLTGLPSDYYGNGSYLFLYQNSTTGVDDIEVEVVPEPGTWALMLGGLAFLIVWQRRKSHNR